jgi:hypothetical protein
MRIFLTVIRNDMAVVEHVFFIPPGGLRWTISRLLREINATAVQLESEHYGLERYAFQFKNGYDAFHYHIVAEVLKEDEAYKYE